MIIPIDETQLARLMLEAAEAGARKALETAIPGEKMSRKAVRRAFRLRGLNVTLADKMMEDGTLKGKRVGAGKTSKVEYDPSDVTSAISSAFLCGFLRTSN
jgi:hypothetical protein